MNDDEYYVMAMFVIGDTNRDGEADNKDLVDLFRYVSEQGNAEYDMFLDFNKDGKVNNKDVTLLFRYLSNN